jgi:hypothetical protein
MKTMARTVFMLECAALVLFVAVPTIRAQKSDPRTDGAPSQSVAPYPPMVSWASSNGTPADSEQLTPDQRPLTGVQPLTLGQYSESHSFLLPSVNAVTQLETNPPDSGSNRVSSISYLLGRLDLHHVSGHTEIVLDYAGGGAISSDGNNGNAVIQDLQFSDMIQWQRWSLFVGDETTYLSESSFGFGGVGGLGFLGGISQTAPGGALGGSLPFLNTELTPSETIPTANVPRLNNTAVLQAEYRISPRSSWTAAASYGLLQFFGAGYIKSSTVQFQAGYNYQLSPLSSIGVLYGFDTIGFGHMAPRIYDHAAELTYGRRVTGRLSFQLAAGPQIDRFQGSLASPSNHLSWTLGSSLNYQVGRSAISLSYAHLLTAGSGVLAGAETNQVQASVSRNLSPTWLILATLGYARNQGLAQAAAQAAEPAFKSWYAAVQVNHQQRPGTSIFLAYGTGLQGMNAATCTASNCGANYITQQLSVGLNWGLRPIELH